MEIISLVFGEYEFVCGGISIMFSVYVCCFLKYLAIKFKCHFLIFINFKPNYLWNGE